MISLKEPFFSAAGTLNGTSVYFRFEVEFCVQMNFEILIFFAAVSVSKNMSFNDFDTCLFAATTA